MNYKAVAIVFSKCLVPKREFLELSIKTTQPKQINNLQSTQNTKKY